MLFMKLATLFGIIIAIIFVSGCINSQEDNVKLNLDENLKVIDYSQYKTQPTQHTLMFTRNLVLGKRETINFTTYGGVNSYLASKDNSWYYTESVLDVEKFVLEDINNPVQDYYLKSLADKIKSLALDKDEQARIAISIAQLIRYDEIGIERNNLTAKYPYEVIHTERGVCGEKSELVIYLLKNLGFETAYLDFEKENHAAVGIKCPKEYSYVNSGYCFVESTDTALVGESNNLYVDIGRLSYNPKIFKMSDGLEYKDIINQVETAKEEIRNGTRFAVVDASGAVIARVRGSINDVYSYHDVIIKYPD